MTDNEPTGVLHQLLAVRRSMEQRANEIAEETKKVLTQKHYFNGSHRAWNLLEIPDESQSHEQLEIPDEEEHLSWTVGEKIRWFLEEFGRLIDLDFQIDETNMGARADLECRDLIIKDVPAIFLMDLEKYLLRIRSVVAGCQVLDDKVRWRRDPDKGDGVWVSDQDDIQFRTKKKHFHKVMVEPTEHQPAQVKEWTEDVRIAKCAVKYWSGAVTAYQKSEFLRALDDLLNAVKKALSKANEVPHSKRKMAGQITDWLFRQSGIPVGGVAKDQGKTAEDGA